MKTSSINVRVEPELKGEAERIFKKLGISFSEAISMFLSQVTLKKGIPFEVKIPNKETIKAMEEMKKGINVKSFSSIKDFLAEYDDYAEDHRNK